MSGITDTIILAETILNADRLLALLDSVVLDLMLTETVLVKKDTLFVVSGRGCFCELELKTFSSIEPLSKYYEAGLCIRSQTDSDKSTELSDELATAYSIESQNDIWLNKKTTNWCLIEPIVESRREFQYGDETGYLLTAQEFSISSDPPPEIKTEMIAGLYKTIRDSARQANEDSEY